MRIPIILALGSLLVLPSTAIAQSQTSFKPAGQRFLTQSHTPQPVQVATVSNSLPDLRRLALHFVNQDRRQNGLPDLVRNPVLDQVAQAHAEDMIRQNYFSHYSKDGRTPMQRVQATGSTMRAGENILNYTLAPHQFSHPGLIDEFQSLFYDSPSHRKIMLRSQYSRFGYGIASTPQGRIVAVQLFGTP